MANIVDQARLVKVIVPFLVFFGFFALLTVSVSMVVHKQPFSRVFAGDHFN